MHACIFLVVQLFVQAATCFCFHSET